MIKINRRGNNSLRKWYWSIDSILFFLIITIILIGILLITTASPPVAERLKLNSFYFVHRQFLFLFTSVIIIISLSLISERNLRKISLIGLISSILLMIIVLFVGEEVKGAKRWINLLGLSIQPSEIAKPFFIFFVGLFLSEKYNRDNFPGFTLASGLQVVICALLILQPDFGMLITYTIVTAGQLFLAGLSIWWITFVMFIAIITGFCAYTMLPHVARRIDNFINPEASENYQIEKSLESYVNGGLFGRGPGEGTVKSHLPDSHTDFIFAVAGEEFGAIVVSIILLILLSFIVKGFIRIFREQDLFKIYVCGGILILFSLQSIFNIGVTLHLLPTKGMTLPFISYGGSSSISFAICFGVFLNLTRKNHNLGLFKSR
jgi:cell division protein FtsW